MRKIVGVFVSLFTSPSRRPPALRRRHIRMRFSSASNHEIHSLMMWHDWNFKLTIEKKKQHVNHWVRAAMQVHSSYHFIYLYIVLSRRFYCFQLRGDSSISAFFIYIVPDSTFLCLSVALILNAPRLRIYKRNEYLKLSRKSKTVNGMDV